MHVHVNELKLHPLGRLHATVGLDPYLHACQDSEAPLAAVLMGREVDERRHEVRIPAKDSGSSQVLSPLSEKGRFQLQLLNVSNSGMKILVSDRLQVGMVLQIKLRSVFILGEVRYCVPCGNSFHVGIQIQDLIRRSS